MPPTTLQTYRPSRCGRNRRRPKSQTAVQVCLRFFLILVGLFLLIALLMKLGIIQENPRPVYVASGF